MPKKIKSTTQETADIDLSSNAVTIRPKKPKAKRGRKTNVRNDRASSVASRAKTEISGSGRDTTKPNKPKAQADPELSRLQKNARNKEYRMRRMGASNEAVGFASPRVSYAEVKRMSVQEKAEYKAKLKAFNARENKLQVAAYNGTIQSINSWANKYNAQARRSKNRIEAIPIDYSVSGAKGAIKPISQWKAERGLAEKDPQTGIPTGRVFVTRGQVHGSVSELGVRSMTKPKDFETARKREETLKRMAQTRFATRRKALRKSVDDMVRAWGDDALASAIASMSNAQFDVLIHETNFMAEITVAYSPFSERKTSGMSELRAIAKGGEGNGNGAAEFQSQKNAAAELVEIVLGAVR